jgi:hypothetical protein
MANQVNPENPEQPKPKRQYRKRRKRAKRKSPKPLAFLSPRAPDSSTDSSTSSEPESTPADSEKFDEACAEVLADFGAADPDAGNRIEMADASEEGEPNPEFEKMAKVYLPKPFAILAYLFEDDAIALNKEQIEILVPECALSLEEIWPYLPEWFKNSRFKHTLAFTFSLSFVAGENCLRAIKKTRAAFEKPKPDPHVSQSSTSTAGSRESSDTSPSPGGVRLI